MFVVKNNFHCRAYYKSPGTGGTLSPYDCAVPGCQRKTTLLLEHQQLANLESL